MTFKVPIKVAAPFMHDITINEWLLCCYTHFYDAVAFMPKQTSKFVAHFEISKHTHFIFVMFNHFSIADSILWNSFVYFPNNIEKLLEKSELNCTIRFYRNC